MAYGKERVLVLSRRDALPGAPWRGIDPLRIKDILRRVQTSSLFKPRDEIEDDPSFKQVIPYVVFQYGNRYLFMQRTAQGAEHRLHNNYSLGIGGHLREEDMRGTEDLMVWAEREFREEVNYEGGLKEEVFGILNDDSNPVGEVHLGIVILAKGDSPNISVKDEHKLGELKTVEEMAPYYPQMESWSQMVFDYLKRK